VQKALARLIFWCGGGSFEATVLPLLVYEKARDHFDGEARLKYVRWCLRYIARHARIQPEYFEHATVREIEREVSETSEMLRDEMAHAKKAAKELYVRYVAFPPYHFPWVPECPEPPYMYNKPYDVRYFFMRNVQIAEYCDVVVAFIPKGVESKGSMHTIREAKKRGKDTLIIN
jgi:hypothetical protein